MGATCHPAGTSRRGKQRKGMACPRDDCAPRREREAPTREVDHPRVSHERGEVGGWTLPGFYMSYLKNMDNKTRREVSNPRPEGNPGAPWRGSGENVVGEARRGIHEPCPRPREGVI